MNAWRMYGWSLVALVLILVLCTGCAPLRWLGCLAPTPPVIAAPSDPRLELPAGTKPSEEAAFFRKKASEYRAAADLAEAEAKRAKLEARQAYLWWFGVASIVLGCVAFALAFAYPVASFLRIGGWAGIGGGAALLAVGEALPYLGLFSLITVLAIAVALVVNSQALKTSLANGVDEVKLKTSNGFVKSFLRKQLGK
jgi:hypothetical protein